jgi:hypothetical protein
MVDAIIKTGMGERENDNRPCMVDAIIKTGMGETGAGQTRQRGTEISPIYGRYKMRRMV